MFTITFTLNIQAMKKEHTIKKIGLWLDHAEAHFIHPDHSSKIETSVSDHTGRERHRGEGADGILLGGYRSSNNEHHKHRREENALHKYYLELQGKLQDYDEIYLFGPGPARNEFFNMLKEDKHFSAKKIEMEAADHLSENQMKAKVNAHFGV